MSAGLHLVANGGNTEGLFHAAFLQSGSIAPVGDVTNGQRWYDSLVRQSGCAGTNDTLTCIRETLPLEVIDAIQATDPSVFDTEVSTSQGLCMLVNRTSQLVSSNSL